MPSLHKIICFIVNITLHMFILIIEHLVPILKKFLVLLALETSRNPKTAIRNLHELVIAAVFRQHDNFWDED